MNSVNISGVQYYADRDVQGR